jgi:hypothetical protein
MCRPPALVGCCEGAQHCARRTATGKVDRLWPASARIEQLLGHAFQEVSDGLLGNAILELGVYPTKVEFLPCVMACLWEGVVVKAPAVAVVVNDFDSVFGCVLFESKLGSECFG